MTSFSAEPYDVIVLPEARRALERLPSRMRRDVMRALRDDLMRAHQQAVPFESRGRTYYRAPIADAVMVIYRPLDPGERGATQRPTFAVYACVPRSESAS